MKDITLLRLKQTARLEKMIEEGRSYGEILKQSKEIDKYIACEMKRRNTSIENNWKKEILAKLLTKLKKNIKIYMVNIKLKLEINGYYKWNTRKKLF